MNIDGIPKVGFVRLSQILGDKDATPPIPAIIPISESSWWAGVKSGIYPQSVKIGVRSVGWNVDEIRDLVSRIRATGRPCHACED